MAGDAPAQRMAKKPFTRRQPDRAQVVRLTMQAAFLREVTGGRAGTAAGAPVGNPDLRHFTVDPADEERMPVGARRLLDALRTGDAFSPGFDTTSSDDARELIQFLDDKERTRRYLEAGWRGQQAEHGKAIALHEDMLRTRDEYIADLLRHRG